MKELKATLLDHHFARFLGERSGLIGDKKEIFVTLVKNLSAAQDLGHSCLPLSSTEEEMMLAVPLVSAGDPAPLVLSGGRLYLHRFYTYEKQLAVQLSELATLCDLLESEVDLNRFFPESPGEVDYQKEAAKLALGKSLAIICGGPGTGKTTTVVKILALLLEATGRPLKIALAAPTGKAAMRLADSVTNSLKFLNLGDAVQELIPTTAHTLHRLLGYRHGSPKFIHNSENPMYWDLVVVDEASMVDLAMMSKLVDGLKPEARLILLGDKDQLASVESGSVLADLMESLGSNSIELQKSYRFDKNIKRLAYLINSGDGAGVWRMFGEEKVKNILLLQSDFIDYISGKYSQYLKKITLWPEIEVAELFREFSKFQVLCGVHFGKRGVEALNRAIELNLQRQGFECFPELWYAGRPVLILKNDYELGLFNGDVGLCLPDPETKSLSVYFEASKGRIRNFSIKRLPQCQTVYCMTIHKSQGSEFDEVVVVLPKEDNRVLSRELLYTGVTRAKKQVKVVGEQSILSKAIAKNVTRYSGLSRLINQEKGTRCLVDIPLE